MNKYAMYKCMESSNTFRTSSCKTKKIITAKEVCTPALRFWTTCILLLRLLLNFVSIRRIYQTRESVFNRQSRHLECRQKCSSRPISSRCLDIQMKQSRGTPAVHLGKLQRLQNAAVRLVCTVSRYDYITPSLINLHWLPVSHRREFKIAMLVHKCIYGVAPLYSCFRLDKNQREFAVSAEIISGHTSNRQYL